MTFWSWIANAVVESVLFSVLPLYTLMDSTGSTGASETFLLAGTTCITAVVVVVNFKMFFIQARWL